MVCRGLTRPRLSDDPIQGRYVEVVKLNERKMAYTFEPKW